MEVNCKHARQLLSEHVDGRLAGPLRRDLENHLTACVSCREEEQSLRVTWELLGNYPTIEPSPNFFMKLRAKLRRPAWKVLGPIVAVAAAVVLTVGLFVAQGGSPKVPVVTDEERELAENLELLENYDTLSTLELIADESAGEDR